jgi:general secretion pathway protein L
MNLPIDRGLRKLQVRYVGPLARRIGKYWTWWIAQLTALLPAHVQATMKQQNQSLHIEVNGADFIVRTQSGSHSQDLGTFASESDDGCDFALPDTPSETVLVLPADKALIKELTLPLATEENLREALSFQIDRQTPFSVDQVCYDCQVTSRDTSTQTLSVNLIMAPRDVTNELLDCLATKGLSPDLVSVRGNRSDGVLPANLLPPGRSKKRWRGFRRKQNLMLVSANFILLLIAVTIPVIQRQQAIASLEPQLERAIETAKDGAQLRRQAEELTTASEYLRNKKQSELLVMRAMDEVTRLLPDHTSVSRLDIGSEEIQVQGQSSATATLIPLLEASPLLQNVRFRSPVVQIGTTAEERFHLSADLMQETDR